MMLSGDEFYDDEVTSGLDPKPLPAPPPLPRDCAWCEDWADGFDPEPCPKHSEKS